ncbi:MAG: RNA-binding S4 domain-containing protein [Acidobacteria bacterium]|nr:RNA-binding S4 domain-containing protein [Acidobacteriota bacterium]
MRLDLFLKVSRLIARRSLAQEFCDKELIEVNGTIAKASKDVKAGDEVTIKRRNRKTVLRIVSVPQSKQVPKAGADELFQLVREEEITGEV